MTRITTGDADLSEVFASIRREAAVPAAFPAAVLAAAAEAAASVDLPAEDLTDLPFFTVDPPGSMDLDQAMCLERDGDGHRVRYAIADVPAFVPLGGPVDAEARERGVTVYAPDARTPLHPPVLSEGAASLLPDQVRPAFVWDLRLDAQGRVSKASVGRARVRSARRLDYQGVDDPLLAEIGERRIALETARGGAELPMPEQEVEKADGGGYELRFRPQVASEDHNAQISLMTGMAAATLMIDARVGVLRTLPAPEAWRVARLRRQAIALGAAWPQGTSYGVFLRSLDLTSPAHAAVVHAAARLFRGAAYVAFDGAPPEQTEHAGVAAPYTHVTAPLRRLVDRFSLLVCAAISAGQDVPREVRAVLPLLPDLMSAADRRAGAVERACRDAVEAAVLAPRVGEIFRAVVVDVDPKDPAKGSVQLTDPAVLAPVDGEVPLGEEVSVRLAEADPARRVVRFVPA